MSVLGVERDAARFRWLSRYPEVVRLEKGSGQWTVKLPSGLEQIGLPTLRAAVDAGMRWWRRYA